MLSRKLLPLVLLLPFFAQAAIHKEESLCHPNEQIVFSCPVHSVSYDHSYEKNTFMPKHERLKREKIISLCATKSITPQSGELWYRFGLPDKVPDFTYPNSNSLSPAEFTTSFESWAKGENLYVSFKYDDFIYRVYSKRAAFEVDERSNGGGVIIEKSANLVADYWCDGTSIKRTKTYVDHIYDILIAPNGIDSETSTYQ